MNITITPKQIILGLVVIAGLFFSLTTTPSKPSPEPKLLPNLRNVFGWSAEAHRDALLTSGFFDGFASAIAFDGESPNPKFSTGTALEQLRLNSLDYCFRGFSFSKYSNQDSTKDFAKVVGDYLDSAIGTSGEAITKPDRDKWVSAYKTLAAQAKAAAN